MDACLVQDLFDFLGKLREVTAFFANHVNARDDKAIGQLPGVQVVNVDDPTDTLDALSQRGDINVLWSTLQEDIKASTDQGDRGDEDQCADDETGRCQASRLKRLGRAPCHRIDVLNPRRVREVVKQDSSN